MAGKICFNSVRIVVAFFLGGMASSSALAGNQPVLLGPANPGAENGFDGWYHGVLGGGSVAAGNDDPATGYNCFKIGITNAAAYGTNHADIRSETFPLQGNRGPFTLSFAYKIPGKVAAGDNVEVHFRFFGKGEDNFLGETVLDVGSETADSEMTQYKTMTATNIVAPEGAIAADIWIVANIFSPWTSGYAHFDDFSVTAIPRSNRTGILAGIGSGALLVCLMGFLYARRRRARKTA